MLNYEKGRALLKRFRDDNRGNVALMFSISAVAVVGCMGAAMDFSTRSSAKHHSQAIADQLALAAAIYVKNNDAPPTDVNEGYTHGKHTAADLGFEYKGWVDGGAENVTVDVAYDDTNKEATVTVSGATIPTFMQVLGKHDMSFSATSTVSYLQVDEMQPASVIMVLDNSGSMRWDRRLLLPGGVRPSNPESRLEGLQDAVKDFRISLRNRIGDQRKADGHRVLRTGILPYNSQIIPRPDDKDRRVQWGFWGISNTFVDAMTAEGATNSNPPMALANDWLDSEDAKHRKEANDYGEAFREPIKFVVFMTDGQNTTGNYELIAESGTGYYYKKIDGVWYYTRGQGYAQNNGFTEGRLELDSDRRTLETCREMHAKGVRVFTIGYALQVGQYYDPLYPDNPAEVTEGTRSTAYSLLSQCASQPENFIAIGQGNSIDGAFDQIQNAVVKELIRIKS